MTPELYLKRNGNEIAAALRRHLGLIDFKILVPIKDPYKRDFLSH